MSNIVALEAASTAVFTAETEYAQAAFEFAKAEANRKYVEGTEIMSMIEAADKLAMSVAEKKVRDNPKFQQAQLAAFDAEHTMRLRLAALTSAQRQFDILKISATCTN